MDTTLSIERIKYALDKRFSDLIDLSDVKAGTLKDELRKQQLSRSLAALAIVALSEASDETACKNITDGFRDLGLDAIYFEDAENTLYVVQAKWSEHGRKTIDLGECNTFLQGVDKLIHTNFSEANDRLKNRQEAIGAILLRPEVRITLVVVHTGANKLGDDVAGALQEFLRRQNNVGDADVFTLEVFDLTRVYQHLVD